MASNERPLRFHLPDGRRPVVEMIDDDVVRILATKTGAERLALAADALEFARQLVRSGVSSSHPEWDDGQVAAEVARRMLGDLD